MSENKWYQGAPAQVALMITALSAVLGLSLYWSERGSHDRVETELVLSQTAVALPGAASYADGQFSIEIDKVPGSVESVAVRVVGPEGLVGQWQQGLGRRAYRYGSNEFFVDILSVMDDRVAVTDVTVSILRKL